MPSVPAAPVPTTSNPLHNYFQVSLPQRQPCMCLFPDQSPQLLPFPLGKEINLKKTSLVLLYLAPVSHFRGIPGILMCLLSNCSIFLQTYLWFNDLAPKFPKYTNTYKIITLVTSTKQGVDKCLNERMKAYVGNIQAKLLFSDD